MDRGEDAPIILAGGHAAYNPEPMSAFIDVFAIGEGEEVIHEIIDSFQGIQIQRVEQKRDLKDLTEY